MSNRAEWHGMSSAVAPNYAVQPISPDLVDRAFPIVSASFPTLTLGDWRRFCGALVRPSGDGEWEQVVLALNTRGYIKGLGIFAVRDHWFHGRLLDVPVFVPASAADAEKVAVDLLNFFRRVRAERNCAGIRFWPTTPETWEWMHDFEQVRRADRGVFTPAHADFAEMLGALNDRDPEGRGFSDRSFR
jgi:hypothetical protein